MTIQRATRAGLKPLVGFYGKSGSGKTMSALLFGRGLVGPAGRLTMVDSENGRGSIFADVIPGSYNVLNLDAPFSPERYGEAIGLAARESDAVIVDSFSHEWSGEGGVLDMQEAEFERMGGRDSVKMASWIKPKLAHKKLVADLLRCKCPVIVCMRGEEKTHILKGDDGKSKVITDQFSSPLGDPRFIFEMLVNFETIAKEGVGGYVIPRKITHPDIARLLPGSAEQIGIKTGEAVAQWCLGPTGKPTSAPASSELAGLKKTLWELTKPVHHGDKAALAQFLVDETFLDPDEQLEGLSVERLSKVIERVKGKIRG